MAASAKCSGAPGALNFFHGNEAITTSFCNTIRPGSVPKPAARCAPN